eukprot:Tbor_TRINITY_DN2700_c0_g1::TRINITY_DN2700_c0_g1_i1::g.15241::m.15241
MSVIVNDSIVSDSSDPVCSDETTIKRSRVEVTPTNTPSNTILDRMATFEQSTKEAAQFENSHVHEIYNKIAPHFSSTRYKPWPQVREFVHECCRTMANEQLVGPDAPAGSSLLLVDVGCGNGKNMCIAPPLHEISEQQPQMTGSSSAVITGDKEPSVGATRTHLYCIGCDRSLELMHAAFLGAPKRRQVIKILVNDVSNKDISGANGTEDSENMNSTDVNSSNQPIIPNHSKNIQRKKNAKKQRTIIKTSTTTNVPEALSRGLELVGSDGLSTPFRTGLFDIALSIAVIHHFSTAQRRKAAIKELLRLIKPITGRALIYVWAKEQATDRGEGCDVLIPWEMHKSFLNGNNKTDENGNDEKKVHQRYYHLFVKGELEELCEEINREYDSANIDSSRCASSGSGYKCCVERSYFDKENWCIVLSRLA